MTEIIKAEFSYELVHNGKPICGTIDAENTHFALAHLHKVYHDLTDLKLFVDAWIKPAKAVDYIQLDTKIWRDIERVRKGEKPWMDKWKKIRLIEKWRKTHQ